MPGLKLGLWPGSWFETSGSHLLDQLTNVSSAYSFRKLSSSYSGDVVTLRRVSDDAELAFGLNGDLVDTAAITTWLGGSNGFIKVWHDQSGNGHDMIQATTTLQAQYVANVVNGFPVCRFDGVDDVMETAGSFDGNTIVATGNYTEGATFVDYPSLVSSSTVAHGITGTDATKTILQTAGVSWVNGIGTFSIETLADFSVLSVTAETAQTTKWKLGQERVNVTRYWGGDITEVIILDDGDIASRLTLEDSQGFNYNITVTHTIDLFIAGGQSNMHGADALVDGTGLSDMFDASIQTAVDRWALFSLSNGTVIYKTVSDITGDIRGHLGTSLGVGGFYVHGPEVGFNRSANTVEGESVAIIKFATNFVALEGGVSPWVKGNSIYTAFAAHIDAVTSDLITKGYTPTVKGFLWAQGIDDALLSRTEAAYETDLTQIIADLRADYGTATTPFIVERSVNSPIPVQADMTAIREGQADVVTADANNYLINNDDLTPYVNTHHMSSASQIIAGERFFDAYFYQTQFIAPDFDAAAKGTGVTLSALNKTAAATASWFGARADQATTGGIEEVMITLGNTQNASHMVGICDATFDATAAGAFPGSDATNLSYGWQTGGADLKWFGGASAATDYPILKGEVITAQIDYATRKARITNDAGATWSAWSSAISGTGGIYFLLGINDESATLS